MFKHLNDVNENYFQHMLQALKVGLVLQLLVPVLIIHSIVPCLFTKTTSNKLKKILENR
jgi:hypothetical protein